MSYFLMESLISWPISFWKCNFPANHSVCLSICLSVGRSVGLSKKKLSEFLNVWILGKCCLFYFLLKTPPLPLFELVLVTVLFHTFPTFELIVFRSYINGNRRQNWVTKAGGRHNLVGHSLRLSPAWSVIYIIHFLLK